MAVPAGALIVLVHLALVLHGATRHSAVYDEVVYPTSGYAYLTTGDYRMNPEHPPFLKLWTGLSWIGTGLSAPATKGWVESDEWRFGTSMLYASEASSQALLFRARAMIAVLSALLAAGVFAVARASGGTAAGLAALILYAFDPLVVAHAGLATTDLGAAAFYFLAAMSFGWAIRRGRTIAILGSGALLGLALASKFSTVPLLAVLALTAMWPAGAAAAPLRAPTRRWRLAVGIVIVALLVMTATYGPEGPLRYLRGLGMLLYHEQVGHPVYAFGSYSSAGWWWYFPAAWAVKTPLPVLLASAAGLVLLIARRRREPTVITSLLVAPGLVAAAAAVSSLNLGVRHLLPVVPFLAVAGGLAATWVWGKGIAGRLAVGAGLFWLVLGTVKIHPDEIAFANEAAGGPRRLWRLLSDSNVDWGQSLPALEREVSRVPLRRLYLSYFGTADPAAHGLRYRWIPSFGRAPRRFEDGPAPEGREWIAISATNLLDVYTARHQGYAWLRNREPTALPGFSIALFDITGDAEANRSLGETAIAFGEPDAALAPLERAVHLAPRDGQARLGLARVLAAAGRLDEAAAQCEEAERLLGSAPTQDVCTAVRGIAATR